MNTQTTSEEEVILELRKKFPAIRRARSTAIIHSGGKQTIYGCICGARHTCASSYRQAKHVQEWRENHSQCAARILAEGETPDLG